MYESSIPIQISLMIDILHLAGVIIEVSKENTEKQKERKNHPLLLGRAKGKKEASSV